MTKAAAVKHFKLDRRRKYDVLDGKLITHGKLTMACTGCNEHGEYENSPLVGCGCHECGYTGKRVNYFPLYEFNGQDFIYVTE